MKEMANESRKAMTQATTPGMKPVPSPPAKTVQNRALPVPKVYALHPKSPPMIPPTNPPAKSAIILALLGRMLVKMVGSETPPSPSVIACETAALSAPLRLWKISATATPRRE